MSRSSTMLMIAVLLAAASADRIDLATVKCKDYLASGKENIARVPMWLEGYYSEENAWPVIDFDKMKEDGNKISEFCGGNPDLSLITAAEKVFAK